MADLDAALLAAPGDVEITAALTAAQADAVEARADTCLAKRMLAGKGATEASLADAMQASGGTSVVVGGGTSGMQASGGSPEESTASGMAASGGAPDAMPLGSEQTATETLELPHTGYTQAAQGGSQPKHNRALGDTAATGKAQVGEAKGRGDQKALAEGRSGSKPVARITEAGNRVTMAQDPGPEPAAKVGAAGPRRVGLLVEALRALAGARPRPQL